MDEGMNDTIEALYDCPDCEGRFRSRAAAGAHRAVKHGKRLDGSSAKERTHGHSCTADIHLKDATIRVTLDDEEVKRLLMAHPDSMYQALAS